MDMYNYAFIYIGCSYDYNICDTFNKLNYPLLYVYV